MGKDIRPLRFRFWWAGYNPRDAFNENNRDTTFEVSWDKGVSWNMGEFGRTMRDVFFWMDLEVLEIASVRKVGQRRRGRDWEGQYEVTFRKVVDPELDQLVRRAAEASDRIEHRQASARADGTEWLRQTLAAVERASNPSMHGDEREVKPHLAPGTGIDGWPYV